MRPQGTYGGAWLDGGATAVRYGPRKPQGTFGGAWLDGGATPVHFSGAWQARYMAARPDMPPDVAAALDAYPERTTRLGLGDDGGGCGNGDAEGLGSIFSKIGKAIGKAAKGVAKGVGTVAKTVAKGVKTVATKVVAPAAVFVVKNVGKVAPLVGLVPGVGTVAAGIIGAAGKAASGLANKKKIGALALDVAFGGTAGAGLAVARKGIGGMLKRGKVTPEAKQEAQFQIAQEKAHVVETRGRAKADKAAQKAAQKKAVADRKVQEADAKQAEALVKKDTRSKFVADKAAEVAKQALREAGTATEQAAQTAIAAGVAAVGGGGSGGSPFSPAPTAEAEAEGGVVEAGMFSGVSPVLLIGAGLAAFLMFGGKKGR